MSKSDLTSKIYDETKEDLGKPLSEKELSSLIRASKTSIFKAKEIKKEMNNNFKKVSLHEIAKQAQIEKSKTNNEEKDINSEENPIVDEENKDKKEKEIIEENFKNKEKEALSDENLVENSKETNLEEKIDKSDISKEKNKTISNEDYQIALENARKEGREEGKKKAFAEIKDGADAAIANLRSITQEISKIENMDLSELESIISNKILELSSELSGKIIKALPADFIKKIKKFVASLENIDGKIEIFISEEDYKVLEKNKDVKKEILNLNISSLSKLGVGELELSVNGIKILNKVKKVN